MTLGPAIKKKAEPRVLNTIANRCAYCGKSQADSYQISRPFGIAACSKHAEWAKWDCKAYMHNEGQARLEDGLHYPGIYSFIHSLQTLPNGFSDGETAGWHLMKERCPFFTKVDNAWTIPIYNSHLSITKRIAIHMFNDESVVGPILYHVPLEFPQYVTHTLNLLNSNIYSDYERITGSL